MPVPLDRALDLTGRVVLVTGGTKGVGRGIAERFLEAGATVVVTARSEPASLPSLEPGADGGTGTGGDNGTVGRHARSATFLPADVRDPEAVAALVDEVVATHGRLDVVVNNAGGAPPAEAATASPRYSQAVVALNLLAPLHVAQAANAVMQGQPEGGCIVNIGSVSGMRPSPGTAAYGAAKAGLAGLTRSLAVEWAPRVRVNLVVGGLLATEQVELFYGDAEGQARVAATVPLGRLGTPTDVADACLFLASPLAGWISGAELAVHGGGERPAFLDAAAPSTG